MDEVTKDYYMKLYNEGNYGLALQFFIKHSGICANMTVSELADHYITFKQNLSVDEAKGLARVVVREMTDTTDVKSLFD